MLPTLQTERLTIRPYVLEDAKFVQSLAGDKRVAELTENVPHPYLDGMAERWIKKHFEWFNSMTALALAVTVSESSEYIGNISLNPISEGKGNLGYWLGYPYWGKGYCTEAAIAVRDYAFSELGLEAVYGRHLEENLASGRVLKKLGMAKVKEAPSFDSKLNYLEISRQQWKTSNKLY